MPHVWIGNGQDLDRYKGYRLVRAGIMGLAGLQLASLGISLMPKASLGIRHFRILGGRQNCGRDLEGQLQRIQSSRQQNTEEPSDAVAGSLRDMTHLCRAALKLLLVDLFAPRVKFMLQEWLWQADMFFRRKSFWGRMSWRPQTVDTRL